MQIKLKRFNLEKREYFKLLSALQKRKLRAFLWVIYFLFSFISILLGWAYFMGEFIEYFISWCPAILLIIIWWLFLIYGQVLFLTMSKMNRHQFQSYEYSIDENFLIMNREDGTISQTPLSKIVKTYTLLDHYILQENLVSAHIIPVSSFNSDDDIKAFENQLEIMT